MYNETRKVRFDTRNEKRQENSLSRAQYAIGGKSVGAVVADVSLFWIASSFINVDILSLDWFDDEFAVGFGRRNVRNIIHNTQTLSSYPLYSRLAEKHFYNDGCNYKYLDSLPYGTEPDCRILKCPNTPIVPLMEVWI